MKRPSSLPDGSRGAALWDDVVAEAEFDSIELRLLAEMCAVLNEIDALPPSAVTERRQQRVLLSRLAGQLAIPTDDDQPRSGRSVAARAAANARWRRA